MEQPTVTPAVQIPYGAGHEPTARRGLIYKGYEGIHVFGQVLTLGTLPGGPPSSAFWAARAWAGRGGGLPFLGDIWHFTSEPGLPTMSWGYPRTPVLPPHRALLRGDSTMTVQYSTVLVETVQGMVNPLPNSLAASKF